MKKLNRDEIQKRVQKIYDEKFSFLKFDKFLPPPQQPMTLVSHYYQGTWIALDYGEVAKLCKTEQELEYLMRVRFIDALLHLRRLTNENIKQLKKGNKNGYRRKI